MKPTQWSFRRIEKKYLMRKDQYEQLRVALEPYLEPDDYPSSSICNIYYDTPDFMLIRRSLEKPVYKEKFRVRSYEVPGPDDPVFMEIKKKYKGVVYKRRVRAPADDTVDFLAGGPEPKVKDRQIMNEIDWFFHRYPLRPAMFIAYERLAFRSVEDPNLRITFDRNIRYRTDDLDLTHGDRGTRLLPKTQVLMEIKIPGATPLWLCHILDELEIYPSSFSKYGRCYLKTLAESLERKEDICAS